MNSMSLDQIVKKNSKLSYLLSRPKIGKWITKIKKIFIKWYLVEVSSVLNINYLDKKEIIDV